MKKLLIVLMMVTMASFLLVGCDDGIIPPINEAPIITSDPITTGIVGVAYTYDVEATDPDSDKLDYSFTVMPSGMTIGSATGLIKWTPPAKGDHNVTVKVSDGALDITQSFTIVVREPELQLVGITVDPKKMDLFVGGSEDIVSVKATYEMRGYGAKIPLEDCLFLTNDDTVATVSDEGRVTALEAGTADIIVSYKGKIDKIAVTVIAVKLHHIEVRPDEMDFKIGTGKYGSVDLVIAYYNDGTIVNIDLGECTYKSEWPIIAEVKEVEGVVTVTAVSVGTTNIIVSYKEKGIIKTDYIVVTVDLITYKSLTDLPVDFDVGVILATDEDGAIAALAETVEVVGTKGETDTAEIAWTIEDYVGATIGDYTATGVLTLPADWLGDPKDVTATVTVLNNATDILTYSIIEQVETATIDKTGYTVALDVPSGKDPTALVATFTLSKGATAKVGEIVQISGTTTNDFSASVVYIITAEDGTIQNWTVTVTVLAV